MVCTRCENSGFLNLHQVPDEYCKKYDETGNVNVILEWMKLNNDHDVSVCDCCGNGEDAWYGRHGEHYTAADPPGPTGPYAYNGGLCECH
jgi:hypothetical protein